MILITLAHLGEAESIIKDFKLENASPNYFQGVGIDCLVTGEGPFEAAVKTSSTLAKKTYSKVINIGICGSLDASFPLGTIHPVRSCYLVVDGRPQFKSFTTGHTGVDLITSFERILSPEKARVLKGMGALVDREAWGVAFAAKDAQIPFECFKLISDHAGTMAACELVKEQASELSLVLSQFLSQHLAMKKSELNTTDQELDLGPKFHFTFSMQKNLENLLSKISLREAVNESEIISEIDLESIRQKKISPKARSFEVIKILENRLDPFKGQLTKSLEQWKAKWQERGIHLQTDSSWESPHVNISFAVACEEVLKDKLKALEKLDLATFHKLRSGDVHVE